MATTTDKARGKTRDRPGRSSGRLNTGGYRGGGRPPEEWRRWCREALNSSKAREALTAVVENQGHPHFPKVMTLLASYAYGKPDQHIDVTERQVVARLPEPVKSLEDWRRLYQPMLHTAHGKASEA